MTQFQVPEDIPVIRVDGVGPFIRVSDLPTLCRQEAEKLRDHLIALAEHNGAAVGIRLRADTWLGLRFPEAAPEAKVVHPCDEPGCVKCRTYEGHPTPQPSAEPEKCCMKGCENPIPVGDEACVPCTNRLDALLRVTPSAGERKNPSCAYCDGTGLSEGGNGRKNVCLPCRGTGEHVRPDVPTPSAGDGRCDAVNNGFGCSLPQGHRGDHRAVGARPEEGSVTATRCRTCKEWYIDKAKHVCCCTACACERCKAREAFVTKLAGWLIAWQHSFPMTSTLEASAKKVLSLKDSE